MSIKALQQINAKQQVLEQGLKQMQTEKMRGIEAKADAFLSSSDPIGFIGRLASEAPDEIAPVVNAARRKKKEVMQAQAPQQETVTTSGIREVLTPQPDPRQMAVASLPMRPDMFRGAGGGIVAFSGRQGSFVDALRKQFETANPYMVPFEKSSSFKDFYRDMFGVPRYKGKQDISRDPSMLRKIAPFLTSEELDKELIEEERSAGERAKELEEAKEFYERIGPQGPDPLEIEAEKESFKQIQKATEQPKEQPIVPETATDAAIGEAGVGQQTTEAILVSNLEKARNILRPENVAKDGAIGQQVTDKESKLAEFKSLVDAGNAKAAAALEKEKAALAGDKKEAIYMGLLEMGLGIMGGDDPNAFVNIGKGAKAAFPSLAKSLQDVKDARRRVTDSEIKLAELENTRKIDLAKFDLDLYEKEQTRLANQKNAQLNAEVILARTLTDADTRKDVARLKASTVGKAQLNTYKNIVYRDLIAEGKSPEEAARILQTQSGQALIAQAIQKSLGDKTGMSDEETELLKKITTTLQNSQ